MENDMLPSALKTDPRYAQLSVYRGISVVNSVAKLYDMVLYMQPTRAMIQAAQRADRSAARTRVCGEYPGTQAHYGLRT